MRKYKVICHMATSLDGKIDGNYLETPSSRYFGKEYENINEFMLEGGGYINGVRYLNMAKIHFSQWSSLP